MPDHLHPDRGGLRITLFNGDEVLDVQPAATPQEASRVAIMVLSSRDSLDHGDTSPSGTLMRSRLCSPRPAATHKKNAAVPAATCLLGCSVSSGDRPVTRHPRAGEGQCRSNGN
jgi:hypothetical protein